MGDSLTFAVSGGNPRVDLSLRADADGSFVADVLTERSLAQTPPIRLGAFRGRLPASTLDALAGVVAASLEPAAAPGPVGYPPGTVVRLVSAGGAPPVAAVGEETELAALDQAIAEAVTGALADPVSAIVARHAPATTARSSRSRRRARSRSGSCCSPPTFPATAPEPGSTRRRASSTWTSRPWSASWPQAPSRTGPRTCHPAPRPSSRSLLGPRRGQPEASSSGARARVKSEES